MTWTERVLGLKKAVDEHKKTHAKSSSTTCIHGDDNCVRCAANVLNEDEPAIWKPLESIDIRRAVYALPYAVRELMRHHPGQVVLAGGFIRAIVGGEEPRDIDLFVNDRADSSNWMKEIGFPPFKENDQDWVVKPSKSFQMDLGIQVVWRYKFKHPHEILEQFDYTVTKAAIWFDEGDKKNKADYIGIYHEHFYRDIARKILTYNNDRDSEYLLSIPRLIKYIQKGYSIDPQSLAALITKTCLSLDLKNGLDGIQEQLEKAYLLGSSDDSWASLTQKYVKPKPVVEHYNSGS